LNRDDFNSVVWEETAMEVTNSTGTETKYKITSSGGSGMNLHGPGFRVDEAMGWPSIPPGGQVHYTPKSNGPWTVYLVVRGQGLTAKADSASDRVTLVESNGGYQVLVS
jgi:hypothetical protein